MNNDIATRKIPKKTFIYMGVLIIAGVLSIMSVKYGKAAKATKILKILGFKKVSNVRVSAKTKFIDEETNINGYQYALQFTDVTNHKECRGFVLKDFKGKVAQDLECKEIGEKFE